MAPKKKSPAAQAAMRRTGAREGGVSKNQVQRARTNRELYDRVQTYRARPTTTTTTPKKNYNPFAVVAEALAPAKKK